jgi:RNA polymerase sigma-70 factor, ECF subfamily
LHWAKEHWAEGSLVWSTLALSESQWRQLLANQLRVSTDMVAHLQALHAADFFLACALVERVPSALPEFERQYMTRIREYVLKVTVERQAVDDIAQQLRESMLVGKAGALPTIASYSGKGALGGWVRVAAVRLALNRKRSVPAADVSDDVPALAHDPELAYLHAQAQATFQQAFRAVLESLVPEQRNLLRLHYLQGLSLDQIASLLGAPRSTLGRHLQAARAEILAQTSARLTREHGLSATAVASMVRKAASQMHVTFTKLLK